MVSRWALSVPPSSAARGNPTQMDEIRVGTTYADALPELPVPGDTNGDKKVDQADYLNIFHAMNLVGREHSEHAKRSSRRERRRQDDDRRLPDLERQSNGYSVWCGSECGCSRTCELHVVARRRVLSRCV